MCLSFSIDIERKSYIDEAKTIYYLMSVQYVANFSQPRFCINQIIIQQNSKNIKIIS